MTEIKYESEAVANLVKLADGYRETDPSQAMGLYRVAMAVAQGNGDAGKVPYLQKKVDELDTGPVVIISGAYSRVE